MFVNHAYQVLLDVEANLIATCNTIPHVSNKIDITDILTEALLHDSAMN